MTATLTDPFVQAARPLALEASRRLMALRQAPLVRERKADRSLVTNADRDADQIIRDGLRKAFPEHAILSEESGLEGDPAQEFVWVVDPLDGTKAYADGRSGFSVMIGLMKRGEPYVGVVADPTEGHLFEAVRGGGAFLIEGERREPLHVSTRSTWSQMPMITSTGFPEARRAAIQKALPCPWLPAVNSVGVKVGLLARQQADLYLNHHSVHYWDTCAPQLILEEAGGCITYLDGRPLEYRLEGNRCHAHPTLATNNRRHLEAVQIFSRLMA